ncbi:hypothetical protein MNEG_10406 [Monoraphidium neglectum]|uniref:Uncharacterized protein n=1 Tax=Monoraphidium neglectum TaxID=145388 RepID=A0A0D2KPM3_9CHLO|nr:hypothetical protein MNEG_10406 [Monoraphidium neglectum]KIY97558.1 hypothetical protein MNEG_10406 [Monoraphidium neglectum]|eukprot:XP_013896578.1 hypothetical protein MNEG_10406 [Monoraphidium neglectum]
MLIADPASQHPDALTVESGGAGSAARGLLLIGDLGLGPGGDSEGGGSGGFGGDEGDDGMLRPPSLGFQVLPLARTRPQRITGGVNASGGTGAGRGGGTVA